jgi:hypothetical protein
MLSSAAAMAWAAEPSLIPDGNLQRAVCAKAAAQTLPMPQALLSRVSELCSDETLDSEAWLQGIREIAAEAESERRCDRCVIEEVLPGQPVPAGYGSYLVFLNPSREYEGYGDPDYLEPTYTAFKRFGDAIGDTRAAIWFSTPTGFNDAERARAYCDAVNLDYDSGPYIVITPIRPDRWVRGTEVFYLRLGGIEPARAVVLLNTLEQQVRTGTVTELGLLYEELRQRVLSIVSNEKFLTVMATTAQVVDAIK